MMQTEESKVMSIPYTGSAITVKSQLGQCTIGPVNFLLIRKLNVTRFILSVIIKADNFVNINFLSKRKLIGGL